MMADKFEGFTDAFFAFFAELHHNNNRAWFQANKPRYQEVVLGQLSSFVSAIQPKLEKTSEHMMADPRPVGGSIFRIYRDLRFAKGGNPYKEHGACQFRHAAGKDAHAPGFYVHMEPTKVIFGGGVWVPPSPVLKQIRDGIAANPDKWSKIINGKKLKSVFGAVSGDSLKRPPRGFDAEQAHIEDIKRKSFFLMRHETPELAGSADFVDEVAATFRAASPFMGFLCEAMGQPY
ncbi:MAG: DUF2461 domain-containing protein [Alphaproteobacteria bacterium]